jgi:hypothetical protein
VGGRRVISKCLKWSNITDKIPIKSVQKWTGDAVRLGFVVKQANCENEFDGLVVDGPNGSQ